MVDKKRKPGHLHPLISISVLLAIVIIPAVLVHLGLGANSAPPPPRPAATNSGPTLVGWLIIASVVLIVVGNLMRDRLLWMRVVPDHAVTMTADDIGIICWSNHSRAENRWRNLRAVEQTRKQIMLYFDEGRFVNLPLRAFESPEAAASFKSFATDRIQHMAQGFAIIQRSEKS
jgi:hypothetical protein